MDISYKYISSKESFKYCRYDASLWCAKTFRD